MKSSGLTAIETDGATPVKLLQVASGNIRAVSIINTHTTAACFIAITDGGAAAAPSAADQWVFVPAHGSVGPTLGYTSGVTVWAKAQQGETDATLYAVAY